MDGSNHRKNTIHPCYPVVISAYWVGAGLGAVAKTDGSLSTLFRSPSAARRTCIDPHA